MRQRWELRVVALDGTVVRRERHWTRRGARRTARDAERGAALLRGNLARAATDLGMDPDTTLPCGPPWIVEIERTPR